MNQLNHATIMNINGIFEDAQNIYILMERFTGRPLIDRLKKKGILAENQVSAIIR